MRKCFWLAVIFLVALVAFPQLAKAEEVKANTGVIIVELSGNNSDNIAQSSLGEVASHDRILRLLSGGSLLVAGGVVASVAMNGNEQSYIDLTPLATISAVILGGAGAIKLIIPTESEREYAKMQKEANPAIRELMAVDSLDFLAGKAQKNRLISGVTDLGLAAYNVYLYNSLQRSDASEEFTNSFLYQAVGYFGGAIYYILMPKYVERVNQKVQAQKFTQVGYQDSTVPVLVYNF